MPVMKRVAVVLVACCLLQVAGVAAREVTAPGGHSVFSDYLNQGYPSAGFMRIPGLDFRSSIGFSYSSSAAYGETGMGYYMGHFSYRLGRSLTLNWDIGVGSYLVGPDGMDNHQVFLPNFDLTYRPSEHMLLRLQFQQGHYGSPYRGGVFPRRF